MIELFFEDVLEFNLSVDDINIWLTGVCVSENKFLGDVNIIFCSDEYLLQMNIEHLNHDYFTDVITFDYSEHDSISGDLFISIDRVKENALDFNTIFNHELLRVIVHGVLHLLGYKDKSEEDILLMRSKENFYLVSVNLDF
jgi:probable rRNA maturation factor